MRFIPTRIHGVLDYLVGLFLIAMPWLFDFYDNGAETWIPVILGAGAIAYSLMADYEMGASRKISMRSHLALDLVSGVLLAASPWIFGFSDYVYGPHLVVGLLEIGVSLMTRKVPSNERRHHRAAHSH